MNKPKLRTDRRFIAYFLPNANTITGLFNADNQVYSPPSGFTPIGD